METKNLSYLLDGSQLFEVNTKHKPPLHLQAAGELSV